MAAQIFTATNACATTNITTGAYVQLISDTGSRAKSILISNTSASPILISLGAASSEVDIFTAPPGLLSFKLDLQTEDNQRIAAKSVSGTANTGFVTVVGLV